VDQSDHKTRHHPPDAAAEGLAMERGEADLAAGRTIPDADVAKWLRSWGKPHEVLPPAARNTPAMHNGGGLQDRKVAAWASKLQTIPRTLDSASY
jgi:hypothetical protein